MLHPRTLAPALLLFVALHDATANASWLYRQVSPDGEGGGWTNHIVQDAAGTTIFSRSGFSGQNYVYELLSNGVRRQLTIPNFASGADLAVSADGLQVGLSGVQYDQLDDYRSDLKFHERSPSGQWSSHVIEAGIGPNSGGSSLAYDPQGNPWIIHGRYDAGTLEVVRRDAAGQWHSSVIDSGIQWGYMGESFDLAFDNAGHPHVVFSDASPAKHYWLDNDAWQQEALPQFGDNSLGQGFSFDRGDRAHLVSTSFAFNPFVQTFRRDQDGWNALQFSAFQAQSMSYPALALDAADRPHTAAVAWNLGRFLVTHRWFNGAEWRQETVAGWSSNTSGPHAASVMIDDDNIIHIPFNDTKNAADYGGTLYEARTLGTPLGAPIAIAATYDQRADGTEGGSWNFTEGDREIKVRENTDGTESRMLLSFDLPALPAGARVVGAELDLQLNGNPSIDLDGSRDIIGHAFADDGIPNASDVELGPGHLQVGFLGSATASRFDLESVAVMRLSPSIIASIVESGADRLGIFLKAGDGQFPPSIRTAEMADGQFKPPRLWLYVRLDGDFNLDGVVDSADLDGWRQSAGVDGFADANGDGSSDGADFLIWQRNVTTTPNATAASVIPEPNSLMLALTAIAACGLAAQGVKFSSNKS